MDIQEFIEYVDIEGLEYFLCHKTNDWQQLNNPELLKQCYKLVEAADAIQSIIEEFRNDCDSADLSNTG